MPGSSSSAATLFAIKQGPWRFCCFLALVLIAELSWLTIQFDAGQLASALHFQNPGSAGSESGRWLRAGMAKIRYVPKLAFLMVLASLLFRVNHLGGVLAPLAERASAHRWRWLYLSAHLFTFNAYFWVTVQLWEPGASLGPSLGGWLVVRTGLGFLSLGLLGLSFLPLDGWFILAKVIGRGWLWGAVVAVLAGSAGWWTTTLWQSLSYSTLWAARALLQTIFADTVCEPAAFIVGTSSFSVQILPACSGYEGIGLVWAFLAGYLGWYRREFRWPGALLLFPLGTVLIWFANAVRIASLVAVGTCLSPEVAINGFHSQAGWLGFLTVTLGLVLCSRRFRWFDARETTAEPANSQNLTAALLLPFLVLLAVGMVTGAFSSGFDFGYPLRVLGVGVVLWWYRRQYTGLGWTWSWEAVGVGVAVFVLWLGLEQILPSSNESPLAAGLAALPKVWAVAWLGFRVVGSVVAIPLAEELAFRGYVTRRLIQADIAGVEPVRFSWVSFLGSSILFGALHGRWLAGTLAGMVYALVLYRRKSLGECVMAHGVTNGLIAVYVLLTESWYLW